MPLRSTLTRLGIAAAGGALVAVAATGTAVAGNDPQHNSNQSEQSSNPSAPNSNPGNRDFAKGRVIARNGLNLRSGPGLDYDVVGFAAYGTIVKIFCKYPGDTVDGNPLWYQLADGTWAWASARYIENIGKAPRWC
jgi:uncharacterized protein YgiM (DUF1202 family)